MKTVKITVKTPVEIEIPTTAPSRKIRIIDTKTWKKPDAIFSNIKFSEYNEEKDEVIFTADLEIIMYKRGYIIRGNEKTENNIIVEAHSNETHELKKAAEKLNVTVLEFAEKCEFLNIDETIAIQEHKFTLSSKNWILFANREGNFYDFHVHR